MNPGPCSMAPLVEAKRDGRLDERELASVDRHLATCPECAAFLSDLDGVVALLRAPVPLPSPLEIQRGRMKVLRAAALAPAPPSTPLRRRNVAAAGAIVALAASLVFLLARTPSSVDPVAGSTLPPAGSAERTVTTITPEGSAQFTRSEAGKTEIVALSQGALKLSVRHLAPGERYVVKTGDAEVEVRGTVFRVEAIDDRIRLVSVVEGKVEVRFRGGAFPVASGEQWSRPPEPIAAPPSSAVEASAPAIASAAPSARRPLAPRPGPKAEGTKDDGSPMLTEGVGLIARGDYGAAAEHLQAFEEAHPGDDRAEDAAFLVIVAMQRAGRRADAEAAAKHYLARYPAGYRRAEAQAITAEP